MKLGGVDKGQSPFVVTQSATCVCIVMNTLQVGLVLYDMLESIRKEHYGRSKLDLLVCTEGRVYGEHRGSSLLLTCLPSATTP